MNAVQLAALWLAAAVLGAQPPEPAYESQVVGLVVTTQDYDPWRPWDKKTPETHVVQGVVLDSSLIVTTADLVENATVILVEKHGRPLRQPARLVRADAEANLALLTVDEPGFFDDLKPATLAASMPMRGQVSTVRWRSGQLEVAASRISRVDVRSTAFDAIEHALLIVETDLTGGGWCEPLFSGEQLIGLTSTQDDKSATVLPVEFLRSFLASAHAPSGYREFANLDLAWEVNRDAALCRYLGLEGEPRGVLVTGIPWGSSACGVLRARDILLSLDGHSIDAAGYYEHPRYGRLKFTQLVVEGHHAGDIVPARVFRGGKEIPVSLTLRSARSTNDLIPTYGDGTPPPYVIEGGLVFRELDCDFLRAWGSDWEKKVPAMLMTRYNLLRTTQTPSRRRVILLAYVLPSAYTLGHGNLELLPVARINGRAIGSIADVDEAFRQPEGDHHRVVFEPNPIRAEVVLDAATLEAATQAVLDEYHVPQRIRLPEGPLPALGDSCRDQP